MLIDFEEHKNVFSNTTEDSASYNINLREKRSKQRD